MADMSRHEAPGPGRRRGRRAFLRQVLGTAAGGLMLPALPASGRDDDFWRFVRAQYPLTTERAYLNAGGLGPAPYPVLQAVHRTTLAQQALSESGHELIEAAREPVARFFGVQPEEVAFTRNATEGNAIVAAGLDLAPGDEVIFESHAHPGGSLPWLNRQKQGGIRVRVFEPDAASAEGNVARVRALITPRTRVLQVSHVTAPTGIHMPLPGLAALAREHGLWFHVDGAQAAGMFAVDVAVIGCDSYAASGHKWLGAPHGTGFLYVRADRLDAVRPVMAGAYTDAHYTLPDVFAYHPTARRYEYGTRDAAQVVGLAAAVAFMGEIGMERVGARGQHLARYLQDRLRALDGVTVLTPADPDLSASITTFKTDRVPYDAFYRYLLQEHRLRCRVVTEQSLDALRVSTHVFNSEAECDRVVDATRALLAAPR